MPTPGTINILLHGLFFLETKSNNVEIFAPQVPNHRFAGGTRGNITDITTGINWTGSLTGKGAANEAEVASTILQFSKQTVGGFKQKDVNRLITLPWPNQFFSIRRSALAGFQYDTSVPHVVGDEIKRRCGTNGNNQIGLVTVLSYGGSFADPTLPGQTPTRNIHFFHDPGLPHDVGAVNADLQACRPVFNKKDAFDLLMDKNGSFPTTPLDDPTSLPSGVGITPEDGLSLNEPVKTGMTRFFNGLLDNLLAFNGFEVASREPRIADVNRMVNPANCPNMFVLQ
jgi:hypothetical protein